MSIVKTKKPPKFVSGPESEMIRIRLEHKKVLLESALENVTRCYIACVQKKQTEKNRNFRKVFALSRKMEHTKIRLQRVNIGLLRLEEGKYEKLNFFQKITKHFSNLSYQTQKVIFGILFLLPWIAGFCLFFAIPVGTTIWWSLNDMTIAEGGGYDYVFAGFQNYQDVFGSELLGGLTMYERLSQSILDILVDLPTILIFSLFIAVLLNTKFKGHQLVKAIFFIPVIYNMTVINNTLSGQFGTLFRSDLDQGFVLSQQFSDFVMQIGIGNGLVGFLADAVNRIFTIVNKSGIQILVFIAALQSIPAHLYEAAKVEGATKYEMFWKITIPMISPMVLTAAVYTIVDSFVGSELMQFMTVNSQGTTMSTNRPGLYSAISIVYFLANAFIIAIIFLLMRKRVFYYDK